MPYFEIIYSESATTKALASKSVNVRSRAEAAEKALQGLETAQAAHNVTCYRVLDWQGLVVARGPHITPSPPPGL